MVDSIANGPQTWTHRYIDLPDVRLHVTEAGPEDGPLLILLHGFPEFWYAWRHQIEPLADAGFRVLAPDQRGYNLSDKPRQLGAYRLDRLAADVIALIDAVGRKQTFLAGHDWGGAVAWWLGAIAPERIRRLAILNLPHPVVFARHIRSSRIQRRKSWYMFMFQLPWLPERRMARNDWEMGVRALRSTSRPGTFDDQEIARYKKAWNQPGSLRGMIQWYRAAWRRPAPWPSTRVRVPTRIIWGMRDRFLDPQMIEPSLALCDEGHVQRLSDATHWLQHEEPEVVNRLLIEFFSGKRHR